MWADDTLTKWLARHVAERPDVPAVSFQDRVLTWKALEERVRRTAGGLQARGVSRGDVVAVQLPNIPDFIISYFAIARLGAVMCTLHMPYRGAEMLLDSHPKIMQSAIVPMPDPVLGEKACAFIVLRKQGEPLTLEELLEYLLDKKIAKNKLPERLVTLPEMPLTPTRKIIKGKLRIP